MMEFEDMIKPGDVIVCKNNDWIVAPYSSEAHYKLGAISVVLKINCSQKYWHIVYVLCGGEYKKIYVSDKHFFKIFDKIELDDE